MAKAYLVAHVRIDNPDAYKVYTAQVPDIIAKHGGRIMVRGGNPDTLEGDPLGDRVVVVEFSSRGAARSFYESPEYQAILPIRQANSSGHVVIVDGF